MSTTTAIEARRLYDEGHTRADLARHFSVSRTTISRWLDPEREAEKQRERRKRYAGTCTVCGKATDGSNGRAKAPTLCAQHHHEKQAVEYTVWTRELVVAAIKRFVERYGRRPAASDFNPAQARAEGHDWRAERYYRDGDYPALTSVIKIFGTWNAAMRAAGFAPQKAGHYERGRALA